MMGADGIGCSFCVSDSFRGGEVFLETDLTFFAVDRLEQTPVLPGAGIICPKAHRESPFELTTEEWADTRVIIERARSVLDDWLQPDGYNLIWNVMPTAGQEMAHAHLHLIPRFHDEPYAGHGGRWHLKQSENRRRDPSGPGNGSARRRS